MNHDYYYNLARRKNDWSQGDLSWALRFIEDEFCGRKATVLEIGCGAAELLEHLKIDMSYTGLDPSESVIDIDKQRFPTQAFVVGFAENLPFPDNSFDLIFSAQTLQSFSQPKRSLLEMKRVLKPRGKVILIAPNLENPWSHIPATRLYNGFEKIQLFLLRTCDLFRRLVGNLPFRILNKNVVSTTGLFEKGDDDARYIVSSYDVATYTQRIGMKLVFYKPHTFKKSMRGLIRRMLVKMPIFRYYQGGMAFVFQKP